MLAETSAPVASPCPWLAAGTGCGAGDGADVARTIAGAIGGFSCDLLVAAYLGLACCSIVRRIGVATVCGHNRRPADGRRIAIRGSPFP